MVVYPPLGTGTDPALVLVEVDVVLVVGKVVERVVGMVVVRGVGVVARPRNR